MSASSADQAPLPMAEPPKEAHLRIRSDLLFRSFTLVLALLTLVAAFGGFVIFGAARDQITALAILLAVLSLAAFRMFTRGLSAAAFHRMNNEGLVFLSEGALEDATRAFEELARRAKGPAVFSVVALYNLAYAELRRNHLERAQSILAALEHRPFSVFAKETLRQGCAALQAFIYSLQGNASAARQWLIEARTRQDDPKMIGYLVLAESIAFVHEQRFEEAEAVLEKHWAVASSSLTGNPYGALRLLRAHVWQALGRPARQVYEMIAGAKPYHANELAYLRGSSPGLADLAALIEAHAEEASS